jgi:hypothetical protein
MATPGKLDRVYELGHETLRGLVTFFDSRMVTNYERKKKLRSELFAFLQLTLDGLVPLPQERLKRLKTNRLVKQVRKELRLSVSYYNDSWCSWFLKKTGLGNS